MVVDPDLRKLFAIEPVSRIPLIGGFDDCVKGSFDVIAILDVFYAIPIPEWDGILTRIHARLPADGVLLIKEMDPESWKQRWNAFQERLSSRFLGITLAATFNYESREVFVGRLQRHGFASVVVVKVDCGYPHPHLLYIASKSEQSAIS